MEPRQDNAEDLQSIVSSIAYLETEARRSGLNQVSALLHKVLSDIDAWITTKTSKERHFYAMEMQQDISRLADCLEVQKGATREKELVDIIFTIESLLRRKKAKMLV